MVGALVCVGCLPSTARADVASGVQAFRAGEYATAYAEFLDDALTGNAVAQFMVGSLHEDGLGTTADDGAAARWYERAVAQNDDGAQFALAQLLLAGRGIERDDDRAVTLLNASAEQGNSEAMNALGTLYIQGRGVLRSSTTAMKWYRQASELRHPPAWYNLAQLLRVGDGVKADVERALTLYRKAALAGHPGAPINLAVMYANGAATKPDYVRAHAWLQLVQGDARDTALQNIAVLEDRMTALEISKAREYSAELAQEVRRINSQGVQ